MKTSDIKKWVSKWRRDFCYKASRQLKPPHGCAVKPETSDSLSWWFNGVRPHTLTTERHK